MRDSRRMMAVTLLAAALCCSAAREAVPRACPPVSRLARQLASRLSASFSKTLPSARIAPDSRAESVLAIAPARHAAFAAADGQRHASDADPFRFRLPPPLA